MTDLVIGKQVDEAMAVGDEFLALMQSRGNAEPDEDVLEDAVAFAGVSRYPARVKCALLGWMAWKDATAQAVGGSGAHIDRTADIDRQGASVMTAEDTTMATESHGAGMVAGRGSPGGRPRHDASVALRRRQDPGLRLGRASATAMTVPPSTTLEEAMRDVVDPELGINVVDLGLVYGLTLTAARRRPARWPRST